MDLGRLLRPRSIAVVGASERDDSYAGETLLNLRGAGFAGPVWGVHPTRRSAHGFECFPSLSELPDVPDAVVVGIPAASVADVLDEAGSLGCGGAVVYGAGFGEVALGVEHERRLREVALRHSLPVCGPNGNGIVAVGPGAAMWGDALAPLQAGPVAMVSQSGNVAVNALAGRRALRFHTVVSCGNATVVDPAEWVRALARDDDVRSIALYLEGDGDGALLCEALAECAERDVGVAVLKVGESQRGSGGRDGAHGRAGRRPARLQSAGGGGGRGMGGRLPRPAGAGEGHERAATASVKGSDPSTIAVLTCSGGDSALAADECARLGLRLPLFAVGDRRAAARPAAGCRDGGQSARLHRADLGRRGAPPRHHRHRRRGPVHRPGARVLRPGRRLRPRRLLGGGAQGDRAGSRGIARHR